MKKIYSYILLILFFGVTFGQTTGISGQTTTPNEVFQGRFDQELTKTVEPLIGKALDAGFAQRGASGISGFIVRLGINIIIPITIVYGILISVLGFYNLMTSTNDGDIRKGTNYILYGVSGTLIMVSARYLGSRIFTDLLKQGILPSKFNPLEFVDNAYNLLVYPFLKLAIYLGIGGLFLILLVHTFRFIMSPKDDVKKKAQNIIIYNTIGILVIIGSNRIVETVYGKKSEVIRTSGVQSLNNIGTSIFGQRNFVFVYDVINRLLGLATLIVLIIIILQAYNLLVDPENEGNISSIRQSIVYVFFGILVIGAGYLITNFVIITPLP